MAAVAGLTVVTLNLIRPLLDEGLFARPTGEPERLAVYRMVARLAGLGLAATLLKGVCKYAADYLIGWVGQRVVVDLRLALFTRLQRLSLKFFHERKTGDLMSRVITDIGAMQQMLTQLFGPAISAVISIIGLAGFILYLNWKLAVLALLVFPVAVWPIRNFGRRLRALSRQVQDLLGELTAHLEEALSR